MKIAVLGGGFTGLTASYHLAKKGHKITLLEKEPVLGGLAVGFKEPGWDWYLERAIHHLLNNDNDIISLADEVGFKGIFWQRSETASLYPLSQGVRTGGTGSGSPTARSESFRSEHWRGGTRDRTRSHNDNIYRIIPVDTPQDFLKFPYLPLPDKLRAGAVLAFLQLSPFFSFYEKQTAEEFLRRKMGNRVWEVFWADLFRKKFGKYAGNILASFIWARIKKRSKKLGYITGGFQTFINHLEGAINKLGAEIKKDYVVESIIRKGKGFAVNDKLFDAVISTLPSPILPKITSRLLPTKYLSRLNRLKFLHAVSLLLETESPLLETTYWLNVCAPNNKIMGTMQHTNFIDKKHYGGKHLLYVYNFVEFADPLIKMDKKKLVKFYLPELKKINPKFKVSLDKTYVFKGPFSQPIFDKEFLINKPDFETPVKNFYIANLDMTYPYDRGTNYAVKLGKEIANFF